MGSLAASYPLIDPTARSYAFAEEVDPDDPTLLCHDVSYTGRATPLWLSWPVPAALGKFPAIIVVHANQGLNDYTRDVARRLAKQSYVALAVDFLSRHGGTKKANPTGKGLSNIPRSCPLVRCGRGC